MKRRAILLISVLFLGILAYLAIFGIRTTRIETIQNLISRNVKIGDSSENVLSFLDSQNLEHTNLFKTEFMRFGKHNYGNQDVIIATKPNTWRGVIQSESIRVVFVFDISNHLIRFDVFPMYTGL